MPPNWVATERRKTFTTQFRFMKLPLLTVIDALTPSTNFSATSYLLVEKTTANQAQAQTCPRLNLEPEYSAK